MKALPGEPNGHRPNRELGARVYGLGGLWGSRFLGLSLFLGSRASSKYRLFIWWAQVVGLQEASSLVNRGFKEMRCVSVANPLAAQAAIWDFPSLEGTPLWNPA